MQLNDAIQRLASRQEAMQRSSELWTGVAQARANRNARPLLLPIRRPQIRNLKNQIRDLLFFFKLPIFRTYPPPRRPTRAP